MPRERPDRTPDLSAELIEQQVRLQQGAAAVRSSLRACARSGADPALLQNTCSLLTEFRRDLMAQFSREERGGFLASLLARRPAKEMAVARLLAEHRKLEAEIDLVCQGLAEAATTAAVAAMEQRLAVVLGWVHDHEGREQALIQEVFYPPKTTEA